ncbi:MAG: 1-(5-phosphoribosyl)-5-[(5-phosphoribosylamino)methylideneamino] imidazole-4-carboxamide isomerase [Acidimicrobiia bacterium]|nr:1-(5-phosphoribosyl)-5-[(5-phosphoribosylamino)methylideneamino] imidazole-4-carboxamide isomerase [Acidimicrobiia bacterium]
MQIIPAVDILDGAAVRLYRGAYDRVTRYADDPAAVVSRWGSEGATVVHVVDLEGARGGPAQVDAVTAVLGAGVPIQLGGGIRSLAAARAAVDAGVNRLVLGSVLVRPGTTAAEITDGVGADRIVAAVDVAHGLARGDGWQRGGSDLSDTVTRLVALGITRALVTGIDRDGTMSGPDIGLLETVKAIAPSLDLIASGGVGSLADIEALAARPDLIDSVIVGRALYEGRFTLPEAIEAAGGATVEGERS